MILDVACGYPNPSEPYMKRGDVGVDIRLGYANILADAAHLPFADRSFEIVTLYSALDHMYDPVKVLREIHRVCRDKFTVTIGNSDYWSHSFFKASTEHYYLWNMQVLEQLLTKTGFAVAERKLIHDRHRWGIRTRLWLWTTKHLVFRKRSESFISNEIMLVCNVLPSLGVI